MDQPDNANRSVMDDVWKVVAERTEELGEVARTADSFYEEHPAILERIHDLTAQKRGFDQRDREVLMQWLQKAHPLVMWTFREIGTLDQRSDMNIVECSVMIRSSMMLGYYQAIRDLMDEEIIV